MTGSVLLCAAAVLHGAAVLVLLLGPRLRVWPAGTALAGAGTLGPVGIQVLWPLLPVLPAALATAAIIAAGEWYATPRPGLSTAGALVGATWLAMAAMGTLWSLGFLSSLAISTQTHVLIWTAAVIALSSLPLGRGDRSRGLGGAPRWSWSAALGCDGCVTGAG